MVLASVGIITPQLGVQCGWFVDMSSRTLSAIREFVGARPIAHNRFLNLNHGPHVCRMIRAHDQHKALFGLRPPADRHSSRAQYLGIYSNFDGIFSYIVIDSQVFSYIFHVCS